MLIYRLLGEQAEAGFTRTWGVSYGLDAARQWQDIVKETFKAAVIMLILERLCLTRNVQWLESYVDYLSLHALLLGSTAKGSLYRTTRLLFEYHKRVQR